MEENLIIEPDWSNYFCGNIFILQASVTFWVSSQWELSPSPGGAGRAQCRCPGRIPEVGRAQSQGCTGPGKGAAVLPRAWAAQGCLTGAASVNSVILEWMEKWHLDPISSVRMCEMGHSAPVPTTSCVLLSARLGSLGLAGRVKRLKTFCVSIPAGNLCSAKADCSVYRILVISLWQFWSIF